MDQLLLRPGTPDDDNRDYLPEKIKGTDIVVNENGNNSQPYPMNLKECTGVLTADGKLDTWYEYIPADYDGTKPVPLVISLHGGLMTGWGQCIYTSWSILAEQNGFIAVFPNASSKRVWCVEWGKWRFDGSEGTSENETPPPEAEKSPEDPMENHDVAMLLGLIHRMKETYNIDPQRIYMQGMSMGNLMTAYFSRYFGNLLAGAAGSGCATFTDKLLTPEGILKNKGGHLPVWQSRPENNDIPPVKADSLFANKYNRYYWMKLNGCDPIPQISIQGESNLAFFSGEKADMVYLDIHNRDHGQTFDDAALVWNYLFSGTRRLEDGTIAYQPSNLPRTGDRFAIAAAEGCDGIWLSGSIAALSTPAMKWQKLKYHGLDGGQEVRGEYIMVPVSFLAQAFGGKYTPSEDTLTAVVSLPDGRTLQFARGSIGCVIAGRIRSMYCEALHRNGELLISIEWFCQYLFNLHLSSCDGVVYITDHFAQLSANMADLIRDLLTGKGELPDLDGLKLPEER